VESENGKLRKANRGLVFLVSEMYQKITGEKSSFFNETNKRSIAVLTGTIFT
jgi:hypothetical protein